MEAGLVEMAMEIAATDHMAIELPLEPESAARARAVVASLRPDDDDSSPDVRLLVSELVADALAIEPRPGETVITVEAEVLDDTTWVMVAFDGLALPLTADKPAPAEPGWGVYLVRTLATRWGINRVDGNTYVWFEA